jgi:hypothetical protein
MKKVIRLTESELISIIKETVINTKIRLNEGYNSENLRIEKYTYGGKENEIAVDTGIKTYVYEVIYTELNPFSKCKTKEDNCMVNFRDLTQEGLDLIINRWIKEGNVNPIKVEIGDLEGLKYGNNIEKYTGLGYVYLNKTYERDSNQY